MTPGAKDESVSEREHTPGPWTINESAMRLEDEDHTIVTGFDIDSPGRDVAFVKGGDEEDEANARLIAAAPDLLDLVRQYAVTCRERIDAEKEPGDGWDEEVVRHYELLLADCKRVIAKAEGQK